MQAPLNIDGHTLEQVEERKYRLTLDFMRNHPIKVLAQVAQYLERAQDDGWLVSQTDEQTFELIPPAGFEPKKKEQKEQKEQDDKETNNNKEKETDAKKEDSARTG